jgi:hypothetical protein
MKRQRNTIHYIFAAFIFYLLALFVAVVMEAGATQVHEEPQQVEPKEWLSPYRPGKR